MIRNINPVFLCIRFVFIPLLFCCFTACNNTPAATTNKTDTAADTASANSPQNDSAIIASQPPSPPSPQEISESKKRGEKLIGKILPDTDDSTLLVFVYGSCYREGGKFRFNNGPQNWRESDSVYMEVAQRLGDESAAIIYIRGEAAITTTMHNFFCETALLVNKTNKGWKVMDAYVDEEVIDYHDVDLEGVYDNRFLIRSELFGVYGGGIEFGNVTYQLVSRTLLDGPATDFITSSSNLASMRCIPDENNNECDCYSREGSVKFRYDKTLRCLVFDYSFTNTNYECDGKNGKKQQAKQTWYMNADTSFLGKGNAISEWGEEIGPVSALADSTIRRLLMQRK